jgi:hypothetical protein
VDITAHSGQAHRNVVTKKLEAASVAASFYIDLLLGIIAISAVCSRCVEGCRSATQFFCRDASPAA